MFELSHHWLLGCAAAAVAVPIVLHLIMRQRPRRVDFPAIQFLQVRPLATRRRLRLRHWLLLLIRCLAVFLVGLALTRPRVAATAYGPGWVIGIVATLWGLLLAGIWRVRSRSEKRGLAFGLAGLACSLAVVLAWLVQQSWSSSADATWHDDRAPVAAAIVIDTSPRMEYRHENESRVQHAHDLALEILRQLPRGSHMAVVDGQAKVPAMSTDLGSAVTLLRGMTTLATSRPLAAIAYDAVQLLQKAEPTRRELFIVTDLTAGAWNSEADWKRTFEAASKAECSIYLLDVGVVEPRNVSVAIPELSGHTLAAGTSLQIHVDIRNLGPPTTRNVELVWERADPRLPMIVDGQAKLPPQEVLGRQSHTLSENGTQGAEFIVPNLIAGMHHGFVRLSAGEDGLAVDDIRYFTVDVRPPWPVLVVDANREAGEELTKLLSPDGLRPRFECVQIDQAELAQHDLGRFATVCLLNPRPIPDAAWNRLAEFVRAGGALIQFLGHQAQPLPEFQSDSNKEILPGTMTRTWSRTDPPYALRPTSDDHPILRQLRGLETTFAWSDFSVFRAWQLQPLHPDAVVLMEFDQGLPAIIETSLGKGRILTMTTPIVEPAQPADRKPWNWLLAQSDSWPVFMLIHEMFLYASQSEQAAWAFEVGHPVQLTGLGSERTERYQLFTPDGAWHDMTADHGTATITTVENAGIYRLKTQGGDTSRQHGFSANLPADISQLERVDRELLDNWIGKDEYQLARTLSELDRGRSRLRGVRDLYPLLVILLVVALSVEQSLANRFYPPV